VNGSTFSYYSEESRGGDAVWKPTESTFNWKQILPHYSKAR
jgi:hypothetical protein